MRVRVVNQAQISALAEFLRSCECSVTRVGAAELEVEPGQSVCVQAACALAAQGCCYGCGRALEEWLSRLGSPLCLDCREHGGIRGFLAANTQLRDEWTREYLQPYLEAWFRLEALVA